MPIRSVSVMGELQRVSQEEVATTVDPYVRNGFFRADVVAIRQAVQALPWVREVSVRRLWPATLQLHILEQDGFARWRAGGLVNSDGDLFLPAEESYPRGLPELDGPTGSEALLVRRYREIGERLGELGLGVSELVLDERRAWHLRLDNGVQVMLGRNADQMPVVRFVSSYPQVLAPRIDEIARVDMRYTNGFAVRWKEGAGPGGGDHEGKAGNAEES